MGLHIHKQGLLDTLQDAGRFGYQHLGINPGGVMDQAAMKIANFLVGNDAGEAVLEMHFPAAEIVFEEPILIAICGADFQAEINGSPVPVWHPILVQPASTIRFRKKLKGARVYLAVQGGFVADEWLDSKSTHLKVKAGGFAGRALQKNDRLLLQQTSCYHSPEAANVFWVANWYANAGDWYVSGAVSFVAGPAYALLDKDSRQKLREIMFGIENQSDRMGYRLQGEALKLKQSQEMISSAVTRGTIQLLPNGQLIILMADHQTTGGYPVIGYVTSADFATLAQMNAGEKFFLKETSLADAEAELRKQERDLQLLKNACNFRLAGLRQIL